MQTGEDATVRPLGCRSSTTCSSLCQTPCPSWDAKCASRLAHVEGGVAHRTHHPQLLGRKGMTVSAPPPPNRGVCTRPCLSGRLRPIHPQTHTQHHTLPDATAPTQAAGPLVIVACDCLVHTQTDTTQASYPQPALVMFSAGDPLCPLQQAAAPVAYPPPCTPHFPTCSPQQC